MWLHRLYITCAEEFRWRERQGEENGCSLARRALRPDRSAVSRNDRLDDGESQSAAAASCTARAIDAIEPLKDIGQVLWANAGASIADPREQPSSFGSG